MATSFQLNQHPRRPQPPLSAPPAGYFERLPRRVMARVAPAPARQPWALEWLLRLPASLRTGLASTLLLGAFAGSLWLGGGLAPSSSLTAASLDAVPREQMLDYLLSGEAHPDLAELGEPPHAAHRSISRDYLQPSARELTDALDAQPVEEANF